jgi:hypothetical protein
MLELMLEPDSATSGDQNGPERQPEQEYGRKLTSVVKFLIHFVIIRLSCRVLSFIFVLVPIFKRFSLETRCPNEV